MQLVVLFPKKGMMKLMGFRFRYSVKILPGVRMNLSRSGTSFSFGGRGLRYTVGPKGNRTTVGIPGTGLSWTEYQPHTAARPKLSPAAPQRDVNATVLNPVENAPSSQISACSTCDIAPTLNEISRNISFAPAVLVIGIALVFLPALFGEKALAALAGIHCALFTAIAVGLDRYRQSIRIDYRHDDLGRKISDAIAVAFDNLKNCNRVWAIQAEGRTWDRKRNAGATELQKRRSITLRPGRPRCIRGNIRVPSINAGSAGLYFFPDALLITEKQSVAALAYNDVSISTSQIRFIETETVPTDAAVVDSTWLFVNKNGGPDRRFNNNKQIPVCLYGEMSFSSAGGLNTKIQFSQPSAGDTLMEVVRAISELGGTSSQNKSVLPSRNSKFWGTMFAVFFATTSVAIAIPSVLAKLDKQGQTGASPTAVKQENVVQEGAFGAQQTPAKPIDLAPPALQRDNLTRDVPLPRSRPK